MREQYVMFKEFCEICDICPTTGRKAIAKKKVSYRKCQEGKLHYYEIPMSEVLRYKREREERARKEAERKNQSVALGCNVPTICR